MRDRDHLNMAREVALNPSLRDITGDHAGVPMHALSRSPPFVSWLGLFVSFSRRSLHRTVDDYIRGPAPRAEH